MPYTHSPARQDTATTSCSEDDSFNGEPDQPIISKLFTDAELYDRYLTEHGCGRIYSLPEGATSVTGFADLIAGGLDSSEKAIAGRLAKIAVRGDTWSSGEATGESQTYESGSDDTDDSILADSPQKLEHPGEHSAHRSSTTDGENWRLKPDEVVSLLIDEFGPLAGEGEEEKLIVEADGALFQDVFILGVIHLTTHRIAFHASLLATRPDLAPQQQIVKAGPAIVHTQNRWHKKRRVWMEISHDMVSTYASSRDEDHIRPMRTVLFSNIKEVHPINPKRPKIIQVQFEISSSSNFLNGIVEFDTVESAQEWRREMQGALYLYRHRRRQAIGPQGDTADELNGIRLSIPLSHIDRVEEAHCFSFTYMLTLHLDMELLDSHPYTHLADAKLKDGDSAQDKQPTKLNLVTLRPNPLWNSLQQHVQVSKERKASAEQVVIDFGPLSFVESDVPIDKRVDKEGAVREALALGNETDLSLFRARIHRKICSTGFFVVSSNYVGFWSKSFASAAIRYRLPISIIKGAKAVHTKFMRGNCMSIELEGQGDVQFDFKTADLRDCVIITINAAVDAHHLAELKRLSVSQPSTPSASSEMTMNGPMTTPSQRLSQVPHRSATMIFSPLSRTLSTVLTEKVPTSILPILPKAINVPQDTLFTHPSMHFVCLTIGSRGDVQPYIALGLGLQKEGHRVTIVTHEEYKEWVVSFGIGHKSAGGDPGALMKLSVENKMFSPEFFKESLTNFRPWLDQLLIDSWESCQGADVLLESPSAMAGVHIAEALNIPYFRCFTMPWTKTKVFPHAFLSPPVESPTFNSASYVLFDNVMWTATSGQINKWRRNTLHLGSTDMEHMALSKVTFIYNFSTAVVPKPLDWADTTVVSGYWFLDNPDPDWTPPPSLIEWMAKARADEKPIVYIGFGSITVPNSRTVSERIIKAVLKSGVRAIISKGWSSRMVKNRDAEKEVEYPPECYPLDKVPHDWLFPQIDAALHHGGAGTTGASLRAGIPTLIKPWFGDQYFWASRVHKLGAGLKVPSLKVNDLAEALVKATSSRVMREKAASVGARIRTEDGVHNAIHAIYTYLPRARRDRTSLD